jgi:CheY-like chemotaxis protein
MHTSAAEVGSEVRRPVLRACIVDDHVAVRQWLADQLEGLGIEVCASSGTLVDGAAAVLAHHPDLVVVDNRLPDGRGIDLCREISDSQPEVALILHTTTVSPLEETQAYQAGVTRVALKSIQGDDLMAALAELTSHPREAED